MTKIDRLIFRIIDSSNNETRTKTTEIITDKTVVPNIGDTVFFDNTSVYIVIDKNFDYKLGMLYIFVKFKDH